MLSKVRTSDMTVMQTLPTGDRPIGVTFDAGTNSVWVANYSGSLLVFADS
jgi:DNA-binding beta-propeller fold protein YncE